MRANDQIMILVCSILLTGCMQTTMFAAGEPDWLRGEAANYPNAKYVTATGSAADAETAQKRAQANLAKVFEVRIRESATTTQDVEAHKSEGVETVRSSQRIDSRINVSTDKLIAGARIAEQWQNPDDQTRSALAVLDRRQAGHAIRDEIERLDNETAFKLGQADGQSDDLLRLADLQAGVALQEQRGALQKTLQVIDLSGRGMEARWSRAELDQRLQQALNALQMRAVVSHDSVGGLDQVLHAAMAQAGFVASDSDSAYRLVLDLVSEPSFQQQNWHWQRARLALRLETPEGSVRGQKSWSLKVSASRAEQLNTRLRASIETRLKDELGATVLGFVAAE